MHILGEALPKVHDIAAIDLELKLCQQKGKQFTNLNMQKKSNWKSFGSN